MRSKLIDVCSNFGINDDCIDCKAISNGLINDSFWMKFRNNIADREYMLQRINSNVFKSPENVMENIIRVTEYIKKAYEAYGDKDYRSSLVFFQTNEGKYYYVDESGGYWRLSRYIRNSIVVNNTDDLDIIREIGYAFGNFQNSLDGFPVGFLHETIVDFHNTKKRYVALKNAINNARISRLNEATESISYLLSVEDEACKLTELADNGILPYRVTHNDTKCNNVLLDEDTRKALCVIDLDTVMPGLIMHDFGDAARYICNTTAEDSKLLNRVSIDMDKFTALSQGFLSPIKDTLTKEEADNMANGVFVMATELAVRFLTDYLEGDRYFKINYSEHNLIRTKCQIALSKRIAENLQEMNKIVNDIIHTEKIEKKASCLA